MRLQLFDKEHNIATFLSAMGEEALKIYEGMTLDPPESSRYSTLLYKNSKNIVSDKPMKRSSGISLTPDHRNRMKVSITMYQHLEHMQNREIFVSVYMIHLYAI